MKGIPASWRARKGTRVYYARAKGYDVFLVRIDRTEPVNSNDENPVLQSAMVRLPDPCESPIPLKGEGFEDASLRLQRPGAACVSHMGRTYHDSNRNASAATEETRRHVGAPRCALSSRASR